MREPADQLAELSALPTTDPTESTVQADLQRARAALKRRRVRTAAAGAALTAALATAGSLTYAATSGPADNSHSKTHVAGPSGHSHSPTHVAGPSGHSHSPTRVAPSGPSGVHHSPKHIRLVAYEGTQLPGFTVSKIPEGYVLQGAKPQNLDIAEPGDHTSLDSFTGKLVVMLQSKDVKFDRHGKPVTINGHPGYLRWSNGTTHATRMLEFTDGKHDVQVQCWDNIALTDDQLVQFASGVTVTSAARATHG